MIEKKRIKGVGYFRRRAPSWMFDRIINATLPFTTKIGNIPWNVWRRSPEFLMTFPGMFCDIPRNVWWHSPECLPTFPGIFGDIPRNITFPPFPAFPAFRSPFLCSWSYIHSHISQSKRNKTMKFEPEKTFSLKIMQKIRMED